MKQLERSGAVALAVLFLAGLSTLAPAAADDITVTSWGGAYSMSQREAYYKPYTAETGITVLEDEWNADVSQIRVQVETGNYKWHVVDVETDHVIAGCDEGVLEEIDYEKLGGRERFLPGAAHDCGVATISWATIYAYDGDIYPETGVHPQSMADFFDTERFPGKRAMWKTPKINLEFALIADGVPAVEVYDLLSTEDGLDRAFAKLATIKDHIIWWDAGAQAPQLLADGEVIMTTAYNGRIYNANVKEGRNFVIVWDGQAIDYDFWVIPMGHPEADKGMDFIVFASRPEIQSQQSRYISYGPTTYEALEKINPEILPDLPTAHENMKNAFSVDALWWADRREELTERFHVWLAQ